MKRIILGLVLALSVMPVRAEYITITNTLSMDTNSITYLEIKDCGVNDWRLIIHTNKSLIPTKSAHMTHAEAVNELKRVQALLNKGR